MEVVLLDIITYLPLIALILITISGLDPVCKIMRNKSIKNVSCFPFLSIFTNCSIWTRYGLLVWDIIIISSNSFGVVSGFIYVWIYFYFADTKQIRMQTLKSLIIAVVIVGVVTVVVPFLFDKYSRTVSASSFVGIFADTTSVIMRASPLIMIKEVISYKSTKHLSLFMSSSMTLHGFSWILYAWFIRNRDIFVLIPNVLGFLAGCIQLLLFVIYGRNESAEQLLQKRTMHVQGLSDIQENGRIQKTLRTF